MATKLRDIPTVQDALNDLDRPNVHRKLSAARKKFHTLQLKKTGKNTFAGYDYFELGDFLIPALDVFEQYGLGATISFDRELATMTIRDLDNPEDTITLTSPMGSAALKGCHEVQNIGAVETYQRRYLWVAALEIVEHDALDKTTGKSSAEPETTTITQAQFEELEGLREKAGVSADRFCKRFEIDAIAMLPAKKFAEAKAALANKIKEPANA